LGSGLGAFADEVENAVVIPYEEIRISRARPSKDTPDDLFWARSKASPSPSSKGGFIITKAMSRASRFFPVRAFRVLGVKNLILTNAAGSVNTDFPQGSLMLIRDHINLTGINPLRGRNDERFGARFPDMTEIYALDYQEIVINEARQMAQEKAARKEAETNQKQTVNYFLRRGIYCGLVGPSYETPAEIRMLRLLGTDALGMSTVAEAIAARHVGMKVIGISCITNMAAGISDDIIHHEEVMETGAKVAATFKELLKRVVKKLN
jgi:purine-nucleoside phosphorylase